LQLYEIEKGSKINFIVPKKLPRKGKGSLKSLFAVEWRSQCFYDYYSWTWRELFESILNSFAK